MAPKALGIQGKEKSFTWTDSLANNLLLLCQEYQKKHGHEQSFSWVDVAEEFEKKTGKKCHYTVAKKKKFDHMKLIWRAWTDLRYNETGIGWDQSTRLVLADDDWWEKKLKENDKYRRFRRKGVSPDISELWDQVFGCIVATGKPCVAPTMDPRAVTDLTQQNEDEDEDEDLVEDAGRDDDELGFEDGLMGLNDGYLDEEYEVNDRPIPSTTEEYKDDNPEGMRSIRDAIAMEI